MIRHLRILGFHEAHPGRAAGCEHGPALLLRVGKSGKQLVSFLHDGQVRGKVGVEYIVEADPLQGGHHAALRRHIGRQVQGLRPGCADRRSHLHHGHDLRVRQSAEHLRRIVPFSQRARGTMGDALTADAAVRFLNGTVAGHIHRGPGAGVLHIPDMQRLHLIADLHAAHALDAFPKIPDQREFPVPGHFHDFLFVGNIQNAQIVGELLQVAVAAAHAGGAVAVVLGQDQLHVGPAHGTHLGRIGEKHHSLLHRIVAGGDQLHLSLHLHNAGLTGADFVDSFQIA